MKKKPWRLPTILGLLFLLMSLLAGVFLVKSDQVFFLRADPEITPREIKISNLTDASFTVSWITSKPVSGFVQNEKGEEKRVFGDDRDQLAGQVGHYTTHHVTVKNLESASNYVFRIGSGGKMFDDNGQPFRVSTGATLIQAPPATDPAYGEVKTADGKPATGAIVYLSLPGAILQSTLVKPSGSWLITLSLARSKDLSQYATYNRESSLIEIFVQGGQLGTTNTTIETRADSPAPALTLGESPASLATGGDVDGVTRRPTVTSTPEPTKPPSGFGIKTDSILPTAAPAEVELRIDYPDLGEAVTTFKPEFFGKGPRRAVIEIVVNSTAFFGQVVTDEQGNWRWSPPENLASGEHKVTVRYEDESGQVKIAEHHFTVLAAEGLDLPSFTSTPSATPIPTEPVVTPSPIHSPTPSPPPRTIQPGTEVGLPQPGHLTPTFLLPIMGITVFLLGLVFKKLTIIL